MEPGHVVLLAYDGIAGDEARALIEILHTGEVPVVIASVGASAVTSFHGRVIPERTVAEIEPCAALVVPGGMGVQSASVDADLLAAIRQLGNKATWLGSTSTGSIVLAAAGLINGETVTTHWLAGDLMAEHSVELSTEPFVEHGRCLSAAGLASTGTLAFRLVAAIAGVENEKRARAHYRPGTPRDDRYERAPLWWRTQWWKTQWWNSEWWKSFGQRTVKSEPYSIDPDQVAEVVVLDIHQPQGDDN